MKFIIGTRGSRLALWQTEFVAEMLSKRFPGVEFEKKVIKTTGDKIRDVPLAKIGGKGLFVKEIDEAVSKGKADFAVHSMKDVPTDLLPNLEIACVPKREDTRDALISKNKETIDQLPKGAVIGTSSLRRRAQLLNYRDDLTIKDLRGNVDTRIRKVLAGEYNAIIMAKAGLKRLGFQEHITQELPLEIFTPSVGQGAIAIVARKDFEDKEYLSSLNHVETMQAITAERALLKELGGGCQVPIGVTTSIKNELVLKGVVLSPDGEKKIEAEGSGDPEKAEEIGKSTGKRLLLKGADAILKEVYGA